MKCIDFGPVVPIMIPLSLLVLIAAVIISTTSLNAGAEIDVTGNLTIQNETISYSDNITISSGGIMSILNSTITFNCTISLQYGIIVKSEGTLLISDLDGNDETEDDASHLTGKQPFFLIVEDGAIIEISNSFITSCGENLSLQPPFWEPCGLIIRTDQFSIRGTIFSESYDGLYLDNTIGGLIEDCRFIGLAIGIESNLACDLVVRNCSFRFLDSGFHAISARRGIPYIPIIGRIEIERCTFNDIKSDAILIEYPRNISVRDCIFERLTRMAISFIGLNPDTAQPFDAISTIERCLFEDVLIPIALENIQDIEVTRCDFSGFNTAVYLQKGIANMVVIHENSFSYGWTGVNFQIRRGSANRIEDNDFRKLTLGIMTGNSVADIVNNTFESINVAGILHQGDGQLDVTGNRFSNNTYGIKVERDLLFKPAMFLENNEFEANYVGLSARDVPLTISKNAWVGNEISILLLGMDVSIGQQTTMSDSAIGIKSISSHCVIENLTSSNDTIGIMADLDTDITLVGCVFRGCASEVVASNSSVVTIVDSLHSRAFTVNDGDSIIRVYWTSVLHLFFLSDGRPAIDIPCVMTTSSGTRFGDFTSDIEGDIGPVRILQLTWNSSGPVDMLPYDVVILHRDKEHPFQVRFEDEHRFSIGLDDIPPWLSFRDITDGMKANLNPILFLVSVHDNESRVEKLTVITDGQVTREDRYPPEDMGMDLTLDDGSHVITVSAMDEWMNTRDAHFNISIDTLPPRLIITSPLNGTVTNLDIISVNGTVKDAKIVLIGDESVTVMTDGTFSSEVILPDEGKNPLKVRAIDDFNNSNEVILIVVRDTTPPSLEIHGLPELTNRTTIEINGSTDGMYISITPPGIWMPVDGSFSLGVGLEEGINDFNITASDGVGNTMRRSIHIVSDRRIIFEITDPPNGATVMEDRIPVNGRGETGLRVRLISGNETEVWSIIGENGSYRITLMVLSYGQNFYTFEVRDLAGNLGIYQYSFNKARKAVAPESDLSILVLLIALLLITALGLYYLFAKRKKGVGPA